MRRAFPWLGSLLLWAVTAQAQPPLVDPEQVETEHGPSAAQRLVAAAVPASAAVLNEILERSPELARARHLAAAAQYRAPQVSALDDPVLALTWLPLPPETRTGPQRLSMALSQRLPWMAKLRTKEQIALFEAAADRARVEQLALELVTEGQHKLVELAFLELQKEIIQEERQHLTRHEEAARARYAAGSGLQQEVLKVQAEITRSEQRLLAVQAQYLRISSSLNRLRDRPAHSPLTLPSLAEPRSRQPTQSGEQTLPSEKTQSGERTQSGEQTLFSAGPGLEIAVLRRLAIARRPDLRATRLEEEASALRPKLAELGSRPDFQVGLAYTLVDRRRDGSGRLNPPEGNGDDILGLTGSLRWPLRRRPLEAAYSEALEHRHASELAVRSLLADIDEHLADQLARLTLMAEQWSLGAKVLEAQALEAQRSAEAAYANGKLGALQLLDAEHVLFQVRTATARALADHASLLVSLQATTASPVTDFAEPPDAR